MKLDLILRNAQILTMDPARPKAKSIGFLHGRIAGLDEDLDGLNANDVVDLGGRTVVPGFIDAHCHTTWFGLGLIEPSVDACANFPELFNELRREASQVPAGEWLVVSGFNHRKFDGRFPDLVGLDAATGNVPLFLRHNSGHLAVVNTAALRMAGLYTPGTSDPAGGAVVRGNDGQPTGVIEETAQEAFQALFQPRPLARLIEAVDEATKVYATQGITSFTDAGIGGGWIGQSSVELAAFQHAEANGQLAARAQLMPVLDVLHRLAGHPADGLGTGLDLGIHSGFGSEMLSLGPVKVFLDGSLLGETAAMSEPFCSHGSRHGGPNGGTGYFQSDPSELRQAIEDAYRSGWAIAAHAIGDRAVDLALDIFEDLQGRYGRQPLPNRIEHASVTRPDQLPKLARTGIAVTPQASFFRDGGDGMSASLGPKRSPWAYRAASFLDAGITVAGSSDRPVADGDVLRGMQAFIDRRTASGAVFGNPSERLTEHQALALYTSSAAKATGSANIKGTLIPGKMADVTVLSGNPLTTPKISELTVDATVLGGVFTHSTLEGHGV